MTENINKSFFVSGTKIYTTNGNKNIEDVKIFDDVITDSGRIKKVIDVYTSCLDKSVRSLKVFKTLEIRTTDNQLFLAIKRDAKTRHLSNPEWIRVDCLDENCFIKIPYKNTTGNEISLLSSSLGKISTPFNTPKLQPLKKNPLYDDEKNYRWTMNKDFFEFLGMWYGSGKIVERTIKKGTEYEGSINIKCPSYLVKKLVEFGSKLFNTEDQEQEIQIFNHRKKSNVKFVSNKIVSIFKQFEKTKLPYFFYSVSNECLKHFIYGWINTSGEITLTQQISSGLVSFNFAEELYHLFRSIGLCCELHTKKSNIASLSFLKNNLDMSKFSKNYDDNRCFKFFRCINYTKNCLEIDGKLYLRVISNNLKFNTKSGYTLEIEDETSYAVEGLIAKCF